MPDVKLDDPKSIAPLIAPAGAERVSEEMIAYIQSTVRRHGTVGKLAALDALIAELRAARATIAAAKKVVQVRDEAPMHVLFGRFMNDAVSDLKAALASAAGEGK